MKSNYTLHQSDRNCAIAHRGSIGGINQFAALFLIVMMSGGCGHDAGIIFEPLHDPPVWPPAPEIPRIRYVGELATSADLKPARSFGEGLHDSLFGEEDSYSMLSPFAICSDGRDRIFVADTNAQEIHVFDLNTREYERWPLENSVSLAQPVGIAWEAGNKGNTGGIGGTGGTGGRLLVSDSVAGVIHEFDHQGAYRGGWLGEFLDRPCGLAIDATRQRLYVADAGAHQVLVFSLKGELIHRLGERGSGPGQFNFPTHVAVDSSGFLFVSDSLNFRVQVFSPEGAFVREIGGYGDRPGYFSHPKGIAIDSEDHLYVVDARFESVQIFNAEGNLLLAFGEEGHDAGRFWLPAGIHIDSQNRIWIADTYNRRIQVFEYLTEDHP